MDTKLKSLLLAQQVCCLLTFEDMVYFYRKNLPYLKDYTIISATDYRNSIDLYSAFADIEGIKNHLHTPFIDGKVNVVNHQILKRLHWKNKVYTGMQYCVSFDTQTVSYFNRYYRKKDISLPTDISTFVQLLYNQNISVDYIPYSMENLLFSNKDSDSIYDTIYTFERLYYRANKSKSYCDEKTKQILTWYKKMRDKNGSRFTDLYNSVYIALLKMCYIQLTHPSLSVDKKMENICEFMNSTVSQMLYPELILAHNFFQKGQRYNFFGKIQKGRSDIIQSIKNMAWDLFHLRMLEVDCGFKNHNEANAVIPCFFTYDERLKNIRDCYALKGIAINEKTHESTPVYANITQIIPYITKYSNEINVIRRANHRSQINIYNIIETLEKDIIEIK